MAVVNYTDDQLRTFYKDLSVIRADNLVQINELVIGKYYIVLYRDSKFLVRYLGTHIRPTDGKIFYEVKILMIGGPFERVIPDGINTDIGEDELIYNIPAADAFVVGGGGAVDPAQLRLEKVAKRRNPKDPDDRDTECPICFEPIGNKAVIMCSNYRCEKTFHRDCMFGEVLGVGNKTCSIRGNHRCPICNKDWGVDCVNVHNFNPQLGPQLGGYRRKKRGKSRKGRSSKARKCRKSRK